MAATSSLVLIDGSHGEGGGALVRTALTLAAITQQGVRIDHVRAGTNYPGLDIEDLILIQALVKSCAAETVGAEPGSSTVSFIPTRRCAALKESLGALDAGLGLRAPNANVVLNAILPVLGRAGAYSQVSLGGETYGANSLCFDYFSNVTLAAQRKLGLYSFPELITAGFGREGGGEVVLDIEPSSISPIDWHDRGNLISTHGVIALSELPMTVAHRGLAHLVNLGINAKMPVEADIIGVDSHKPGICVTVWAEFERGIGGATAMGAKGIRIEAVVQAAFEDMFGWVKSGASVDPYLADQIIPTAILAEGETRFTVERLTKRFLTIVWVIKQFLPIRITVKGKEGEPGEVVIRR